MKIYWIQRLRQKLRIESGKKDGVNFNNNKCNNGKRSFSDSLSTMIQFGSRINNIYFAFALLCSLIGGAIQPTVLIIGGRITNLFLVNGSTIGDDAFLHSVFRLLYFGIVFGVLVFVFAIGEGFCIQRGTRLFVDRIRKEYLSAVLRQDANWHDANPSGSITCKLNENMEIISDGLGNKCCMLFRGFSMFVSSIIACSFINWQLTFVTLTMGPISAFVLHLLTKFNESTNEELMNLSSKSHAIFEESILNVRTVQVCNGQSFMINKLRKINESVKEFNKKSTFWAGFFDGLSSFVGYFITGIALFLGCRLYFDGEITKAGDVILIVNTICVAGYFLGLLGPHLSSLQQAATSFQLLYNVIENAPLKEGKEGETVISKVSGHIVFKDVRFKYPSRDSEILKGLSFEVLPGQTVALVGTSGCGKSTSIGLLTKLYRATQGEILIDGQNIDMLDARSLRQKVGIVQQEPKLFEGTILDNIRLGRTTTENDVLKAIDIANATNFINKLENGILTQLGPGGVQLSGGQKQRICIGRALVTSPSILILDEATSALDSHNERIVNKALNNAAVGRTTLVIAHRLSSLKNVDKIYVIDQGVTKEVGTHDELIEMGGIYAKLAKSQEVENGSKTEFEDETEENRDEQMSKINFTEDIKTNGNSMKKRESSEKASRKQSFSGIAKLWKYVKEHPVKLVSVLLLSIPRALEMCAYGLGMSFAFNTLQRTKEDYMPWALITLAEQSFAGAMFWVINTLLIYLCGWIANEVMSEVKVSILNEVLHKPIEYFDNPETSPSSCVSKIISHAHNCYACVDHRAIRFIWFIMGVITSLLLAFPFVWELGVLGLCFTIILTVFTFYFLNVAHKAHSEKSKQDKSGKFGIEVVEQARGIKLLAVEKYFEKKFGEYIHAAEKYENKIGFISSLNFALTQSYVFACDMLLLYVGTLLIYNGQYTPDKIFLAFNGAQLSAWSVMYFAPWFPEIVRASDSVNHLFSFFDSKTQKENAVAPEMKPKIQGEVEVDNVTFSYPSTPRINVCDGLSLKAEKGQSIALVGASGCGKSTIIRLLERFYPSKSGQINIDNNNINQIDKHYLREKISLVGQEPILFNATIFENITIGLENVSIDDVKKACAVANASNFVENFPLGYDTVVGEGGGSLSGGQKQRIAIARALIRKPKILLLDEATSALDGESEEIVQKALRSATKGRTSITIAHRLSTVRHCDIIYYISKGRVAEYGTHNELIKLNQKYARLVSAQSLK